MYQNHISCCGVWICCSRQMIQIQNSQLSSLSNSTVKFQFGIHKPVTRHNFDIRQYVFIGCIFGQSALKNFPFPKYGLLWGKIMWEQTEKAKKKKMWQGIKSDATSPWPPHPYFLLCQIKSCSFGTEYWHGMKIAFSNSVKYAHSVWAFRRRQSPNSSCNL